MLDKLPFVPTKENPLVVPLEQVVNAVGYVIAVGVEVYHTRLEVKVSHVFTQRLIFWLFTCVSQRLNRTVLIKPST